MSTKTIYSITKSDNDITNTVLENIIRMMEIRNLLDEQTRKENIRKLIKSKNDRYEYSLKLKDDLTLKVKLVKTILESMIKNNEVSLFVNTIKQNNIGIIVASDITNATIKKLNKAAPLIEIFREESLMTFILDSVYMPHLQILSEKDKNQVYSEYKISSGNCPLFMHNDPVVKLFNAKPGDLFRITRNSKETGKVVSYRVVSKNTSIEFDT